MLKREISSLLRRKETFICKWKGLARVVVIWRNLNYWYMFDTSNWTRLLAEPRHGIIIFLLLDEIIYNTSFEDEMS